MTKLDWDRAKRRDLRDHKPAQVGPVLIAAKYRTRCRACGDWIAVNSPAWYDPAEKGVWHPKCLNVVRARSRART